MPADSGTSESPDEPTGRGRSRRCQVLFVIGAGFDPVDNAESLANEFRSEHDSLDFSKAESQIVQGTPWERDDKSAFKKSVASVVKKWCREQAASFDAKRLLVADYRDDEDRLYAVAGYFPRRKLSSETSAASIDDPENEVETIGSSDAPSPVAVVANRLATAIREQPPRRLKIVGAVVAVLLLLPVVVALLPDGRNTDVADPDSADPVSGEDTTADTIAGRPQLSPPRFLTGLLRIYTREPGFGVLIDGEPVRNVDGEFVTTPCAVTTELGARTVTVYREGSFDLSRVVEVADDSEVTLEPSLDLSGNGSEVLNAPHLNAEVGVPIPLASLNSNRPEVDPYVTPDRLSIWFVGDRQDGRGIFVATRQSPYHDFDEPRVVSRSADLPATPSITDDALYIVYAVPEKARLMALARNNPLAGFDAKEPLRHSKSLAPTWTSSQMLGDGLRIYWVEELADGEVRTLSSTRKKRSDAFGKTYKVTMPGTHPCLSRDGLRHYTFDGSILKRFRRSSLTKKLIEDAVLAELELPDYLPSKRHRQFFVSSDEQWLFYSDDPDKDGDLYMVRISQGPQWGVNPRGKSIPPKPVVVAAAEPEPTPEMTTEPEPEPEPVDPRTIPLPYTSHRQIFTTLLSNRQYEQVEGLLRNAEANSELQKFAEQLAWDREDYESIQEFWRDVKRVASEIPAGTAIRLGTLRLEVSGFENGELIGKRGETEIRKELNELSATELSGLFDFGIEKDDASPQYRFAVLLFHDPEAIDRARDQRFERSGVLAGRFQERLARRKLAQAKAELERTNFGKGVAFLKETIALAEGTAVAAEAQSLEEDLYEYVKWRRVGPRQWVINGNSYEADANRSNGSLLVSEKEYGSFELSLEWKVLNTLTAQGGIYFHYPGRGALTEVAHKIQLANESGAGADMYSTGSLFAEEAPDAVAAKPAGEWNTLDMKVVGKKLKVFINGKRVLDTQAFKETVPKSGYVALDGVTGGITYRKILLSDVPE